MSDTRSVFTRTLLALLVCLLAVSSLPALRGRHRSGTIPQQEQAASQSQPAEPSQPALGSLVPVEPGARDGASEHSAPRPQQPVTSRVEQKSTAPLTYEISQPTTMAMAAPPSSLSDLTPFGDAAVL